MDVTGQTIAIADLADELRTYRSSVFKIVKRLGIQPTKSRDASRGNQLISIVTQSEAAKIRKQYVDSRAAISQSELNGISDSDTGVFYLLQLEPEHDPGRFKVGFTTDTEGRLRKHRCSAPFAEYKKTWPCRRVWERAAIDCVTTGLDQLHTEVFRASSLDQVAKRGDNFFKIMPKVDFIAPSDDEEMADMESIG